MSAVSAAARLAVCGDLDSLCPYVNDGICDDGGPGAAYWECPRLSDASDCGTSCDVIRPLRPLGPPPPPAPLAPEPSPPGAGFGDADVLIKLSLVSAGLSVCFCLWWTLLARFCSAQRRRAITTPGVDDDGGGTSQYIARATLITAAPARTEPDGSELLHVSIHKPHSASPIGINLGIAAQTSNGKGRGVVIASLATESILADALKPGDALTGINGCVPMSSEEAERMLLAAEGMLMLEVWRLALDNNVDETPATPAAPGIEMTSEDLTSEEGRCDEVQPCSTTPRDIPAQFRCPISQEIMTDPVTTADGHTYERREIFRWLCAHTTSPLTGAPLPNRALTPAIALRQLILDFENGSESPESAPCEV